MATVLVRRANASYAEYEETLREYAFSSSNLTPDQGLLERADASMRIVDRPHEAEFPTTEFLDLIREGKGRHTAARLLGYEPEVVKQKQQFDSRFRANIELAEEEAAELLEEKLWELAESGERWAMELWLKKRNKPRWGDDPTVVKHEGTITQEISALPVIEQIMALQDILNRRIEQAPIQAIEAVITKES